MGTKDLADLFTIFPKLLFLGATNQTSINQFANRPEKGSLVVITDSPPVHQQDRISKATLSQPLMCSIILLLQIINNNNVTPHMKS